MTTNSYHRTSDEITAVSPDRPCTCPTGPDVEPPQGATTTPSSAPTTLADRIRARLDDPIDARDDALRAVLNVCKVLAGDDDTAIWADEIETQIADALGIDTEPAAGTEVSR